MSDNRRSKFMLACNDGTLKEVRSLLRGRVNINRLDVYGETALIIAARRGNLKIVEAILRKKPKLNIRSELGRTALMLACWMGHRRIISVLLEHGADVSVEDNSGRDAIYYAEGDKEILSLLDEIPFGLAVVTEVDRELLIAAKTGNLGNAKRALQHAASLEAEDHLGRDAAQLARHHGRREIERLLDGVRIERSEEISSLDQKFLIAAIKDEASSVENAIQDGAGLEATDPIGSTALMLASEYGNLNAVEMLLHYGASISAEEKEPGYDALMYACSFGHEEIVQVLVDHGAEVNRRNKRSETPLVIASTMGHSKVVVRLLSSGADHALTTEGHPPMWWAWHMGHMDIVAALMGEPKGSPKSCTYCATLPEYVSADIRHGESLPPAADGLEVLGGGKRNQIRRCPTCGSYFKYQSEYDSTLFDYDEDESLARISKEEASEHLRRLYARARRHR